MDDLLADKSESPEKIDLCIVRKHEGKEVVSKGTLYMLGAYSAYRITFPNLEEVHDDGDKEDSLNSR